jgi:membrane fusion protein (multidrug efflux system)
MLSACNRMSANAASAPGAAPPPPEVTVQTVVARDLPVSFEYVGQTAGSSETEVRARVGGILLERLYEEGSRVAKGAPLFQIDPANFRTQLTAAESAAGVQEARTHAARRELARIAPLAQEQAVSQKEFDDAKSALEIAEATLRQARAQVNEAQLNLNYTRVLAPIGGITGVASKANGSLLTSNDSLLTTLVQTDPLWVNFSIAESDYLAWNSGVANGSLRLPGARATNGSPGFTVQLKLADGTIYPLAGKMNFASEKINPANAGFDARAQFANPNGVLRPGQFVRVILNGAVRNRAIAVPQRAVQDGAAGKLVFTVSSDNKLVPRLVELGSWSAGEWIVNKGLQAGERVLVDGFKAKQPGMTVKPVPLAVPVRPASTTSTASTASGTASAPAVSAASTASRTASASTAPVTASAPPAH